jgi:hypothetical protein
VAYDWDGNGNMITRTEGNQTTQFEYDFDNSWFGLFTRTEVRFVLAMMGWGGEFSGRRAQMCDTFTLMATKS